MAGTVVTFYSYKGGVGRSFALANVAVILAQWGYRVLTIDWDIEAPGLHHYFAPHVKYLPAGVLDFLSDCQRDAPKPWDAYAQPVNVPDCRGQVFLMPASATGGADYTNLVQALDWDELYTEHQFGARLEAMRSAWIENFDFVLIDSRTGVTDFSGVTTAQLPDVLAFLFTANRQSLDGCCDIVRRAMTARRKLPVDRPALVPLPIVAKFEQREEYDRAQAWRAEFTKKLGEFCDVWAPVSVETSRLIDLLTLPYVPRWTFGEDLSAVLEPHDTDGARTTSSPMSYPLETLAAILANGFGKIELLSTSRDEYVLTARTTARERHASQDLPTRVYLSYSRSDLSISRAVAELLAQRGFSVFRDTETTLSPGADWSRAITDALEKADALVVLVSPGWLESKWARSEFDHFLRHSLRSDTRKPIIPLLLPGSTTDLQDSRLSDFAGIRIDPDRALDRQLDPLFRRLSGKPEEVQAAQNDQFVYLVYDKDDSAFASQIGDALTQTKITVFLQLFEGTAEEVSQDFEHSLIDCDSVILCWGNASAAWVRATLRRMHKILPRREKRWQSTTLILAPPVDEHKLQYIRQLPTPLINTVLDWTDPAAIKTNAAALRRLLRPE